MLTTWRSLFCVNDGDESSVNEAKAAPDNPENALPASATAIAGAKANTAILAAAVFSFFFLKD